MIHVTVKKKMLNKNNALHIDYQNKDWKVNSLNFMTFVHHTIQNIWFY